MSTSILLDLIREILNEGNKPIPRPPGYEEAVRDRSRTLSDVASAFGVSISTVSNDRRKLGNPFGEEAAKLAALATPVSTSSPVQKGGRPIKEMPPEYYEMLGRAPISKIAEMFGVTDYKVSVDMHRLEIPQFGKGRPAKQMPQEYYDTLGKVSDDDVVKKFRVSNQKVATDRARLGIPPYSSGKLDMPPEYYAMLGKTTDTEIADRFGVARQKVSHDREAAGIEPFFMTGQVLDPENDRRLGPRK
jgi:hypothetical protein